MITYLGKTTYAQDEKRFGIKQADRRQHLYCIGKTGTGKSTLIRNLMLQDIIQGRGIGVIDPHGDLAEDLLKHIPSSRARDVIYFDPADLNYPIAFNIFEHKHPDERHLVASSIVSALKNIWSDSWGPRLEYILRNTVLALLEAPNTTILAIPKLLTDIRYREQILKHVEDPFIRYFFEEEYNNYDERFKREAIAPIQNKVGYFLSSSLIRNILGQPKSTFDLRHIMDNKQIFIANLSKGKLGEENTNLMGSVLTTLFQLSAMQRVDTPEAKRQDFYLYIDEFQNFTTDAFAGILSEARKYRLNLTLAHQYIDQLPEGLKKAVFGNIGTMISFRIGALDARYLEQEFAPQFKQDDLINLDNHRICLKLMIDGVTSKPFSALTLPPMRIDNGEEAKHLSESRRRFSKDRQQVEGKIKKWMQKRS